MGTQELQSPNLDKFSSSVGTILRIYCGQKGEEAPKLPLSAHKPAGALLGTAGTRLPRMNQAGVTLLADSLLSPPASVDRPVQGFVGPTYKAIGMSVHD